jgi:Tol biopolymer transport system component
LTIHSWNESGGWRLSVLTLADGSRVPVADDLTSDSSSWAPDGSWLAAPTGTGIAIHDDTGEAIDVIEISQQPIDLDVNAGGTTLAYVGKFDDGSSHVFVVDRNGGGELQLTAGEGIRASPVWSPSGQLLAFIETRCDPRGCHSHVVVYDGAQKTTLPPAITDGMEAWPRGRLTWSPDGEWVLYLAEERTTSDGLSIQAPLIAAPLVGAPRVVTIEFGMASYDWQPLPVR